MIGLDVDPPGVNLGIFVRPDTCRLPFESNTFDGTLLKGIVEQVPVPMAVPSKVRRVKRPGATIRPTTWRAVPRAI